jgi:Cu+-exporting ATPase
LFKTAEALERLEGIDSLVVDKTDTLTEGRSAVTAVVACSEHDSDEVLRLAASLERGSEHPFAAAIVAEARARNLKLTIARAFEAAAGKGVTGTVDGKRLAVGSRRLLAEAGIATAALDEKAEALRRDGASIVYVAAQERLSGMIAIADAIKPTAKDAVEALQGEGLRLVMLTGDNRTNAEAVARHLGIDAVEADVLPKNKARLIARMRGDGRTVAMAGDGINDAPALAEADVGIAMGTGADVAIASAGVILLHGDLRGLVRARRLSRATMQNVRQNLAFAFLYNAAGLPIAAGALYPAFGLLLSPVVAAAAMALSSFSVIANALRLRRVRLD